MKLCLGTVQFGIKYGIASQGQPDFADSVQIMETAFVNGVTAFDTSASYGNAEVILGEFIKNNSKVRSQFEIATKLPHKCFTDVPKEKYFDICAKHLSESLKRLNCDYADYILLHTSSDVFDGRIREAMYKLVSAGLTRKAGASIYSPDEAMTAAASAEMECIQIPYNAVDRRLDKAGFFAVAGGKTVFCRSVLLQGLLTMDSDKLPANLQIARPYIEQYEALCKKYGVSKVELGVSYIAAKKGIDYLIIGVDNEAQLFEQIKLMKKPIKPQALAEIQNMFGDVPEYVLNPGLWNK